MSSPESRNAPRRFLLLVVRLRTDALDLLPDRTAVTQVGSALLGKEGHLTFRPRVILPAVGSSTSTGGERESISPPRDADEGDLSPR